MKIYAFILSLLLFFLCLPSLSFAQQSCSCDASSSGQCPPEDDPYDPYDPYDANRSGSLSREVRAPLTPIDIGQSDYLSIADIADPYQLPEGAMQVVFYESSHDLEVDDRFRVLAFYFINGPEYAATFVPIPFEGSYDPDNPDADEFGYVYDYGNMRRIFDRLARYPHQGGGLNSVNWTNFQNADLILSLSSDAISNLIQQRFRQQDEQRATQEGSTVRFGDSYGAKEVAKLLMGRNIGESVAYRVSDTFWDAFDDAIRWCLGIKKKKKKKKEKKEDKPKDDDKDDFDDEDEFDRPSDEQPPDPDDDDDCIGPHCEDRLHCPDPEGTLPAGGFDEHIEGGWGGFTDPEGNRRLCRDR